MDPAIEIRGGFFPLNYPESVKVRAIGVGDWLIPNGAGHSVEDIMRHIQFRPQCGSTEVRVNGKSQIAFWRNWEHDYPVLREHKMKAGETLLLLLCVQGN